MRNLLNPRWIFILNTLPIALLFFILYGEFSIIKSLLSEESLYYWKAFSIGLASLAGLNFIYGVYLLIKKKNVSVYYAFIALFVYVLYLYMYANSLRTLFPFSIPRWMNAEDFEWYTGTFLMSTLVYCMFVLLKHFTSNAKEAKAWKSFLIAIVIPVFWYLFYLLPYSYRNSFEDLFNVHLLALFVIAIILFFLFFLARSVFILITKKEGNWTKYKLYWEIPISIVLPLLGLAVNNGDIGNVGINTAGVFGDFNSPWYYILALIGGVLICLPNTEHKRMRLLLFIARSITFSYTFYFFLVFLPFLPLSIFAIIAVGFGFLMLCPLVLFILHVKKLSKDIIFLKEHYGKNLLRSISIVGFLLIPTLLIFSYAKDRSTLHEALDYVYSPDYSKFYEIDKVSLKRTLDTVHGHKNNNRGGIYGSQEPYLSAIFNWLVLDNLTLSNAKLNKLENIFFGRTPHRERRGILQDKKVAISNVNAKSTYIASQDVWKSWIDLEITNSDTLRFTSEYTTTLALPEGAWISDYYLYVGDEKEMGMLSEKKSAMWVFANITRYQRDPGILYYLTGNDVAFRVFPFAKSEIRKTGFELLHKEAFEFTIDGHVLQLGDAEKNKKTSFENDDLAYVSVAEKKTLKEVKRKPYLHFMLDISNEDAIDTFINRVDLCMEENKAMAVGAKISFVNSYVTTYDMTEDWKTAIADQTKTGGFYLDRAIKKALFNSHKEASDRYPIIVVLTEDMEEAVFENDFSDWKFAFPESDLFYHLKNVYVASHSLVSKPSLAVSSNASIVSNYSVLEYQSDTGKRAYLPNDNKANIVLKSDVFENDIETVKEKDWQTALAMQGNWNAQILHPENSDERWLDLIKSSFRSKVMTPLTSYMVVENEAQKAILKKKQKQVLASKKFLDLGEDAQRMSEPNLIVLGILLGLILLYRNKKKARLLK